MNTFARKVLRIKSKLSNEKIDPEEAIEVLRKLHDFLYLDEKNRIDLFHQPLLKPEQLTYFFDKNKILHIGENQLDFSKWVNLMYKKLNTEPEEI